MNQNEKGENRKALPKFFAAMALSLLAGGVIGFVAGMAHVFGPDAAGDFARRLDRVVQAAVPWGIPVTSVPVLGAAFLLYRSAAKKFAAWGGGDEDETSQAIDILLSWVLLLSSVQLLINFFFMAALAARIEDNALWVVALFVLSCALVIIAQQKAVDLTRRMNPEKRGSVYDLKFQKTWYNSLDESERQQTGQACYRAYMVTSRFCVALWVVLVVLSIVFEMSVLPVFVLLLIWGVMQVTYTLECIRLSKKS